MPKCQPTRASKLKHAEILQADYINSDTIIFAYCTLWSKSGFGNVCQLLLLPIKDQSINQRLKITSCWLSMAFHSVASLLYSMVVVGRVGRARVLCWSLRRVLLLDDLVIHQIIDVRTSSHPQTAPPLFPPCQPGPISVALPGPSGLESPH